MTTRARDTRPHAADLDDPRPQDIRPHDTRQARGTARGRTGDARVIPLRPVPAPASPAPDAPREPLLRDLVGEVLRQERLSQQRTLKDVADSARISFAYLSELERGRKEASSEVLAAAAHSLGLGLADVLGRAGTELARRRIALAATTRAQGRIPGGALPRNQVRLAA